MGFHVRDQVSWTDHDDLDGDMVETGFIEAIDGDTATINCDCGPRRVQRPLGALEQAWPIVDAP